MQSALPLADLTVLDVTGYIAGPYCTKLLAGLGAEVIKVEPTGQGDPARGAGPFPKDIPDPEASGLFLYLNTGKSSITLDINTEAGKRLFRELVQEADILVEDLPPGAMEEWGFGYRDMERLNPLLVYTSISPFGQTGPYRDFKATEIVSYAMGGAMYISGDHDREPLKNGGEFAQFITGQTAFAATMTALFVRDEGNEGQHVDVSVMEALAATLNPTTLSYSYYGKVLPRPGYFGRNMGRRGLAGIYPCKDGYINLFQGRPGREEFVMMAEVMEEDRLLTPEFIDPATRPQYTEEIQQLIEPWLLAHTKQEISERAKALGIQVTPVNNTADLFTSPQLIARDYFQEIDHPRAGKLRYPGPPFRSPDFSWKQGRAPLLGEQNELIYCQRLGYSAEDLTRLRQEGVV